MGDILLGKTVIAIEGKNVSDVEAIDPENGETVKVSVTFHEIGGRAKVEVRSEFSAETRMPRPTGETIFINGTRITHERG